MKGIFKKILILFFGILLIITFYEIKDFGTIKKIGEHYIAEGVQETGAINLVTSVLFEYRGFDTMGEATVILTAAATLAFLVPTKKVSMLGTKFTIIVYQTIIFIVPFLAVLGMYLIFFGHLSPGGGFAGGVVLATIPILITITYGIAFAENNFKPEHKAVLEGLGVLGFILLGIIGILAGSNFLAGSQAGFAPGNPGDLMSASLIPYLNLMIGIKVAAGLAIIFNSMIKED